MPLRSEFMRSFVLGLLGLAVAAAAAQAAPTKTPIAVTALEDLASERVHDHCARWYAGYQAQLREQMEHALNQRGFRVMERKHINAMYTDEFRHENLDPKTLSKFRKFVAAKYVLTGAITEFSYCDERNAVGINVGNVISGLTGLDADARVGVGSEIAKVGMTLKVVNVETGEILESFEAEDEVKSSGLAVAGGLAGVSGRVRSEKFPAVEKASKKVIGTLADRVQAFIAERESKGAKAGS